MDNKQITGRVPMVARQYFVPFILITSLFFLWGGARAILDVLNKHVQMHFEAGYGESALIQCSVYMAYFLGAIPAGMLIRRYGTRRGVITGLLAFAVGAFLFIPASAFTRLSALLLPLFVLGLGLCLLETAANPYVTLLGDSRTSSSRINMSQTFNGLGCMMGALLGGLYFFSRGHQHCRPLLRHRAGSASGGCCVLAGKASRGDYGAARWQQ